MTGSLGSRILAVAVAIVVVSVVAGIIVIGSPAEERAEGLDETRISDLRGIMTAIDDFWVQNDRLPQALTEVASDPRFEVHTIDPVSGAPYEYRATSDRDFELCAVFDRQSVDPGPRTEIDPWLHGPGRACFPLRAEDRRSR